MTRRIRNDSPTSRQWPGELSDCHRILTSIDKLDRFIDLVEYQNCQEEHDHADQNGERNKVINRDLLAQKRYLDVLLLHLSTGICVSTLTLVIIWN